MTKIVAVITAGLFAAGTMFADDNCDEHVQRCKTYLASVNFEQSHQKIDVNRLLKEYQASDCDKAGEANLLSVVRNFLDLEQYGKLKKHGTKAKRRWVVEAPLIGVTNLRQISPRARSLFSA
jgi:hypothetical protein